MSGFVSYRISSDVLAEVFSGNDIKDREFGCSGAVQCAVDEDELIFASENCGYSLAQLMALGWRSSEISENEKALFDSLSGDKLKGGIEDVSKYRLKTAYDGTDTGKLSVIAEIFEKTDALWRFDAVKTNAYTAQDIPSYWKSAGNFGYIKTQQFRDQLCYALAVPEGMEPAEENAVMLLKDGRLTIEDKGGFVWNNAQAAFVVQMLCCVNAAKGAEVIEKVNCRELTSFNVMPGILEIAQGAFKNCPALKNLMIAPRFTEIGKDAIGSGVAVMAAAGSTAETYAREHGCQFTAMELPERMSMDVCIAAGVEITADSCTALRAKDNGRAVLNDLEFEYADGEKDELDCEIIDMTAEEARNSGVTRQLESFGRVVGTETVRNDRTAYIKVTLMQSSKKADVYSCVIEIDKNDRMICIHTEKEFTREQLAVSGQNSLMCRFLELASSVKINGVGSNQFTIPEQWKTSAAPVQETVTAAVETVAETAEPVQETQPETVAETAAASEEEIVPEVTAEIVEEPLHDTAEPETVIDVVSQPVQETVTEPVAETPAPAQCRELVSGERFDISAYTNDVLTVELDYEADTGVDIDGYLFLLAQTGKVRSDADLVFFGQKASADGAVKNDEQKTSRFTVELSKLDKDIVRLAVAFAIYGDDDTKNFSCVTRADVNLYCNGIKLCTYRLAGLETERSTVAAEIYNKGGWKLKTVGLGYKEALKSLCNSFGVQVQ